MANGLAHLPRSKLDRLFLVALGSLLELSWPTWPLILIFFSFLDLS